MDQILPKLDPVKIPKQLEGIREINMGPLISCLERLQPIPEEKSGWPIWAYALIALTGVAAVIMIVGSIRFILLKGNALLTSPITKSWRKAKDTLQPTVSQAVDFSSGADRGTTSAPEGVTLVDESRVKFYPSLRN